MDAELLTKEKIVFFFNKYKYNIDLIFRIERKSLKESYDFPKWESLLNQNSELTRRLFVENEKLLDEYIRPAINNPEKLNQETIQTILLHITFYLFENNVDTFLTEQILTAFLTKPEILNEHTRFLTYMNLGISDLLSGKSDFEHINEKFNLAIKIFPDLTSAGDDDTKLHIIFCRVFQALNFCLNKNQSYDEFLKVYNETERLFRSAEYPLLVKMWGAEADFTFHLDYIMRFMRCYGIFMAQKNSYFLNKGQSDSDKEALEKIKEWTYREYEEEDREGKTSNLIFLAKNKLDYAEEKIDRESYRTILNERKTYSGEFIFPELSFPDDGDPVDKHFSNMLDKMKLFNKTFTYIYGILPELFSLTDEKDQKKEIISKIQQFYESTVCAEKGFQTDSFVVELIKQISTGFDSVSDFSLFLQTVFIHRQISSAIHYGMVSSIAGICFYHFVDKKPELFIIPGIADTAEEVIAKKIELLRLVKTGALLHDIGKIGFSNLINLHYRKISDDEYASIKLHSEKGGEIADEIELLKDFRDFIVGHHKFWNDQGGYPQNFSLMTSKLKNYVNLISIADCLDTATDLRGRNYQNVKTFEDLVEEFKSLSGVRYNPEFIRLIEEDDEIKKELKSLVSNGRNYNSYQTYLRFIQPHTEFSSQDETEISVYTEKFKPKLRNFYKSCFSSFSEKDVEDHLSELLDNPFSRILVIHNKKGEIFGVFGGHVCTTLSNAGKFFFVSDIVVQYEYRRRGLGTELMNAAAEMLKKEGIHKMHLNACNDFNSETFFWIIGFVQNKSYIMEKEI